MLAHHAAFYDTTFHEISADAICNDLPPGCVVERGEVPPHLPKRHSVYWNPNGTTISLDKRVRPICRKTKGKYLLLLDTIYSSILEISEPQFSALEISIALYLAKRRDSPECPKDFRIGGKCNFPKNVECTEGEECCCGKCHPSLKASCDGGKWMGYHTDACFRPSCGKNKIVEIQLPQLGHLTKCSYLGMLFTIKLY